MKKILVMASVIVAGLSLQASLDGYFMLSVFSPGQLPSPSYSVYGGRLSVIYGDCHELYGLDAGVCGQIRENMYGLQVNGVWSGVDAGATGAQLGLINTVGGEMDGLQAGGFNMSGDMYGCQLGIADISADGHGFQLSLVNVAADYYGFQLGLFNASDDVCGFQLGLLDVAAAGYGCQLGLVNVADDYYGCQIGLVNVTEKLHGCQLGLVNVITSADIAFWPVFNMGW